jgi:peptidyl-prolyl cis-trans isomerase A (cyclophilin A)
MRYIPILLVFLFAFTSNARAQVYADVSVSHGANALGTFRMQLHHDKTPRTVANFIGLATGQRNWIDPTTGSVQSGKPYYDGLIFHRLIHDFMIQGGDPLGTGTGGPGYIFQDEFDSSLSHSGSYVVSMANNGGNSNGSQFFITLSAPTDLDNNHSIFGEVIDDDTYPNSRALIDSFRSSANFPTSASDRPNTAITITSIEVSGPDLAGFDIHATNLMLPTVSNNSIAISHDSLDDSFALSWNAQRKFDYPIYFSTDLESWIRAGNLLNMDDVPYKEIGITAIATAPATFYVMSAIDYSAVPDAPQDMLLAGGVLGLHPNGGTLTLTFDGTGLGTWTFVYTDGVTATESGSILSSSRTNNSLYPVIPTSGAFISIGQTYARFLSLRQITAFLDGPAGPDRLTAVQPVLSFHNQTTGWFDGAANNDSGGVVNIRGEFTYTAP